MDGGGVKMARKEALPTREGREGGREEGREGGRVGLSARPRPDPSHGNESESRSAGRFESGTGRSEPRRHRVTREWRRKRQQHSCCAAPSTGSSPHRFSILPCLPPPLQYPAATGRDTGPLGIPATAGPSPSAGHRQPPPPRQCPAAAAPKSVYSSSGPHIDRRYRVSCRGGRERA